MFLYKITEDKLDEIKEKPFLKEIELHKLCERNLEQIFGLQFVKREFLLNNFRIDTLAFDKTTNAFVIIEYKNTKNFSVIDQGYAYLSLMLNHKADFILEYNENCKSTLKRGEVDWSQSRVIFVSPMFSNYQQEAVNFKDLPFELWEVKRFDNDTLYFNPIKAPKNAQSIQTVQITNAVVQGIHKEIKVYSEEDQLAAVNDEIKELYAQIRSYILGLDDLIDIKPKKLEIGFRYNQKIFLDIHLQKKAIKLWFNLRQGELDDPKKLTKNVKETGHWGNGDYELHFSNDENIEYIFSLIKQAYKKKRG
jgi:predicted transport protein